MLLLPPTVRPPRLLQNMVMGKGMAVGFLSLERRDARRPPVPGPSQQRAGNPTDEKTFHQNLWSKIDRGITQ